MNCNIIVKTEDASSEHAKCVKKGKYSWEEDACVWLQHHKRTVPAIMDSLISSRSFGSITGRVKVLRDIERTVEFGQADLSDKKNTELWNAYINLKLGKYNESRFVPQIDTDTIAALSKRLDIVSDLLLPRLQLIRSTKHFLYFSGIHVNEDLSLEEYDVTHLAPAKRKYKARTTLNDAPKINNADTILNDAPKINNADTTLSDAPKINNARTILNDAPKINNAGTTLNDASKMKNASTTVHETSKRSNNLTVSELQALYRFKNSSDPSYSVIDLASEFSKSVDAVRHGLNNLMMQTTEAERIVQEGVTLLWGDDSDLWSDYVSRYTSGSTHPASICLSNIIAEEIARERNTGVLHTHFRLNLIRNLKKFLHIAGIHDEHPSGDQSACEHHSMEESAPVGTSVPLAKVNATHGLTVPLDGELVRKTVAAVLNSAEDALVQQTQQQLGVTDTLAWMITTLETNAAIDQDVGIIVADMINAVVDNSPEGVTTAVALLDNALEGLNDAHDEAIINKDEQTGGPPSNVVTSPSNVGHFADAIDILTTELEAGEASEPQQATSIPTALATVPTFNSVTCPISINKNSLCTTEVNVSRAPSLASAITTTDTRAQIPNRLCAEPLAGTSGAGPAYTMQEDRMIWQAFLAASANASTVVAAIIVGNSLTKTLKRSRIKIERRVKQLLAVRDEADQAVRNGAILLPGATSWYAFNAVSPGNNLAYNQTPSAQQLVSVDLYNEFQSVRVIKWFLDMCGIHETHRTQRNGNGISHPVTASLPTQPGALINAVPLVGPCEHTIAVESRPVMCELRTSANSDAQTTSVPPASSATSTTSTIHPLPSPLPSPLLASLVIPFAFSLANEAQVWRAYVKSQLPSSNKPLPIRLQKLAKKWSCTFPQVKDKLNELINLQLGLTVQCHSSGRPFTEAEETRIASASSDDTTSSNHSTTGVKGGNATSAYRILEVATQLRCSIGAVAVRSRQLKTLRLLQEVGNYNHAKLNKAPALPLHAPLQSFAHPLPSPPTATLPPQLRKKPPATPPPVHSCPVATVPIRDQDCSDSSHPHTLSLLGKRHYTSTDNTNNHKITRTDSFSECNAYESADDDEDDIIAYFSTEGEASDG